MQKPPLANKITELREELSRHEPHSLAARTKTTYAENGSRIGVFWLSVFGKDFRLEYPTFILYDALSGDEAPLLFQAIALYYFLSSDGTPESGRWISFHEITGGQFYDKAFQGYTGNELARAFRGDLPGFCRVAESLGGRRDNLGDASYSFQVLPRVSLAVVYWCGDEDFPSSCQVLFDSTVAHHLPVDACAILGSNLSTSMIKYKEFNP